MRTTTTFSCIAVLLACAAESACGGRVAGDNSSSSSNENDASTSDPGDAGTCLRTACAALEGTADDFAFSGASLCGAQPNAGNDYVIWFDSPGSCVCKTADAGTFATCDFVTPEQCTQQTSCDSCDTSPACAWCSGTNDGADPHCDFRPAFECDMNGGTLIAPACSP